MKKSNRGGTESARVCWAGLEGWVRERVQGYVQDLLQEEVAELLGRGKSRRRPAVDALPGSRNGLGKPRKLTLACGTITVRRPRVRALEERLESRILPLFARRTPAVDELLPELYLHGLAEGDFDLALRGLLGDEAPLSASTVARLKSKWQAEFDPPQADSPAVRVGSGVSVGGRDLREGRFGEGEGGHAGGGGGPFRRAKSGSGGAGGVSRVDGELVGVAA